MPGNAGSLIEEEMTFEELSSKLGGIIGEHDLDDSMSMQKHNEVNLNQLMMTGNHQTQAFNEVNSSAMISI